MRDFYTDNSRNKVIYNVDDQVDWDTNTNSITDSRGHFLSVIWSRVVGLFNIFRTKRN